MAWLASRIFMFFTVSPLIFLVFNLIVTLLSVMLDAVIAPCISLATINCNSLNVSDLGSMHRLIKMYGIAKLKTDIIFISDVRLCNVRGVSNSLNISNTFRTNPYSSYECYFNSNSNKRGVGILIKNNSNVSILQELCGADDNSLLLKATYKGSVLSLLVYTVLMLTVQSSSRIYKMTSPPLVTIRSSWAVTGTVLSAHSPHLTI
jgi:hypothetical protein